MVLGILALSPFIRVAIGGVQCLPNNLDIEYTVIVICCPASTNANGYKHSHYDDSFD